jgi:hypothetical protein
VPSHLQEAAEQGRAARGLIRLDPVFDALPQLVAPFLQEIEEVRPGVARLAARRWVVARQGGSAAGEDVPVDGTHQAKRERGRSGIVLVAAQD